MASFLLIQMVVEDTEKRTWIFMMAEPCALSSVENDNVKCLICNHESQKKRMFKNYHSKDRGSFIAISKSWTNAKQIDDGAQQLKSNYIDEWISSWMSKKVEKSFRKVLTNCQTLISIEWNILTKTYDKSNDWIRFQPWALFRFSKFLTMVLALVVYSCCNYGEFIDSVQS